ncbi:hypothetical protein [Desulfogranum japonicum]|uniref:hypothetical protein n=1 Tax=Desulfogranum japonicum TaxID=231447 RepID=UPI0003FDF429|nr:hypothetical protein [Desulfogranum japonicum]
MRPYPDDTLQNLAWNSLSFKAPNEWTPVTVFRDYLLLEKDGFPDVALRWLQINTPPAPEKILDKMAKSKRFSLHSPWILPHTFRESLPQLDLTGFYWSENRFQGHGILAINRLKGWIVLLQIYNPELLESSLLISLLASIHFSGKDGPTDYALFDIALQTPPRYTLHTYRFLPGKFELNFSYKKSRLFFSRFKPAEILLKDHSLQNWGHQLAGSLQPLENQQANRQTWEDKRLGLQKVFAFLQQKPAHKWLELTHHRENNCILGVEYNGSVQPESFFDAIRESFHPR